MCRLTFQFLGSSHLLYTRIIVSLAFLIYGSFKDIREREVPNKVWVLSIPSCVVILLIDIYLGNIDLYSPLFSLLSASILGYLLYHIGFYGGADFKALILISLSAPSYINGYSSTISIMFPLPFFFIFFSSILASGTSPLAILTMNLFSILRGDDPLRGIEEKSIFKRLMLLATSRRIPLDELKNERFKYLPAERIVEEEGVIKRKPYFALRVDGEEIGILEEILKRKDIFKDGVLASPTIPMLIYLTLGFFFSTILIYL